MKTPPTLASLLVALSPLLGVHAAAEPSAKEIRRSNILMIAVDDLNDWVGAFGGNPQAITPNLDRLAEQQAMVMNKAYCPSTVYCPSRSSILTGKLPSTTGVYGNTQNLKNAPNAPNAKDVVTSPECFFGKNGYHALSTGEIFHKHSRADGLDEGQWAFHEFAPDGGDWKEIGNSDVQYPGWEAHFRVEQWDGSKNVPYRVRHGEKAMFEGLIRRDPVEKDVILVANMSCNSSRTIGLRAEIIENLRAQDPDVLFFGGDQTYRHSEHTAGWIEFGLQFRDIIRDRPTVCIPDDHDVGHGNLWGESGKQSSIEGDADGGFRYPVASLNQVQRQQSWHLPDPVNPPRAKAVAVS